MHDYQEKTCPIPSSGSEMGREKKLEDTHHISYLIIQHNMYDDVRRGN